MTLITILLSILVLLETIRLVILLVSMSGNGERMRQNDRMMTVFRKLEYWLDREDEREDGA